MLTGKGVNRLAARPGPPDQRTHHQHHTTLSTANRAPGPLPGPVTTELVHALAGLAVALAGT